MIVVDGSYRAQCLLTAPTHLNERGVIIVDNSDWDNLAPVLTKMTGLGFRRIEFYGLGPCNGHPWGKSVLCRDGNFLGM